jgi:chromosomal replication initiation ATPase DnaA
LRHRQLALPFAHAPHFEAADFLEAPSNAEALAWLGSAESWPGRRLALAGESGVGKTHLLHVWAKRAGARLLDGPTLAFEPPRTPLAIDDADDAPAEKLLHVLNAAQEAGHPVLLAAPEPPSRWHVALPDLSSRLKAILAVTIGPPEETLLRSLLMRLLAERQLAVPAPVQEWMLTRLPRTPAALREAAARFDRTSLLAGSLSPRVIAAHVILNMRDAGERHEDAVRQDEDLAESAPAISSNGTSLL